MRSGVGVEIVAMDSTHKTAFSVEGTAGQAFLYTLVARHGAIGKGVPLAFMITPEESR